MQIVVVLVVAVAPIQPRRAQFDGVLVEAPISADLFCAMAVRPPAEVAALQYDVGPLLVDEPVERSEIGVDVSDDDCFHNCVQKWIFLMVSR